jgi:putative inorganic carbon (HCO3(-)) transporter
MRATERVRSAARRLGDLEPVAVVLAAPALLFPTFRRWLTVAVLGALLLVWLARWIGARHPSARKPLDLPLLLLMLMIVVGVWASALPEVTLPKLTGLILGLAVFRATVHAVGTPRRLLVGAGLFLALGVALSVAGLLGTRWIPKWPALTPLLAHIPQFAQRLPGAEEGVHPNELAGALVLFLPVSLAALGARIVSGQRRQWTARVAALLLTLFFGAVLVLTQSRSAWMGAGAGLAAMAWARWRPARWLLAGAAAILVLSLCVVGPQQVAQTLFPSAHPAAAVSLTSTVSWEGRVEIWRRAAYAIRDFPFTGTGLGTFRRVVPVLYPLFLWSPGTDIGHAHNVFLQVALDVGLPGLVAYLALFGTALWMAWRVARFPTAAISAPGEGPGERMAPYRWLGLGLFGSLVAFHAYGLTDAVALGAKPGVALWMALALVASAWDVGQQVEQTPADATQVPAEGSLRR